MGTAPLPVQFPHLGFAFFCHCEMVMLLISCMLPDLVFGLKGEDGINFCCISSPAVKLNRSL
jgi:hypothetical protein